MFLHCNIVLKNIGYGFLNMLKDILYSLNYFQPYPNVKLIYENGYCKNTTHIFNINLVYETCKDFKSILVSCKLAPNNVTMPWIPCEFN
jgi:hypothetical protein